MKTPIFLTCLLAVSLTSCSGSSPSLITVEVTRIVQITTTPIPTATITPAPTLDHMDELRTAIAWEIGTPIVASKECYETALTQRELNACAGARLEELEKQMTVLIKALEARYQKHFPEGLEKFQDLQAEWENLSHRECRFRSGLDSDGWPGTMAPMNYGECMVGKYEDRLREYQVELHE